MCNLHSLGRMDQTKKWTYRSADVLISPLGKLFLNKQLTRANPWDQRGHVNCYYVFFFICAFLLHIMYLFFTCACLVIFYIKLYLSLRVLYFIWIRNKNVYCSCWFYDVVFLYINTYLAKIVMYHIMFVLDWYRHKLLQLHLHFNDFLA